MRIYRPRLVNQASAWMFLLTSSPLAYAVTLNPGDDIQAVVNANPAGTTYQLAAGMFRMQSVTPKNGDVFKGTLGAGGVRLTTMSGARLLTPVAEGDHWVATGQTQQGQIHSQDACMAGYVRCGYPEDLFVDDRLLVATDASSSGRAGVWFFDYNADKIYMWDNPAGHRVETGVTRVAFAGSATGVTIQDLIIEKYAIPHQMGAIGDQYAPGTDWVIQNNEVRWNHGVGIRVGNRGKALNNRVHDNGQMGVGGGGGAGTLVEGNEIYSNGFGGVNWWWEGGGTKFSGSNGLIIRGNNVHNNLGPGLWCDIDNINITYENNTVVDNQGPGIFHEISYKATIRNNILKRNSSSYDRGWLWDSQIEIASSQDVEIYNNTIEVDTNGFGHGIGLSQQSRDYTGCCAYGHYKNANNYVHHNMITVTGPRNAGGTGLVSDYTLTDVFNSNNRFDFNVYWVRDLNSGGFWEWQGPQNWNGWKAKGQDLNGCASTNNSCPPPFVSGPGAPTATLTVSPGTITSGGTATLSWTSTGATSLSIAPTVGTVAASGSRAVTPTATTTYTLTATNATGTVSPTATVTVNVPQTPFTGSAILIPGKLEAENFDNGSEGMAFHDLDAANNGGSYRTTSGVDIKDALNDAGGYAIGWFQAGEWLSYMVQVTKTSTYALAARVGSAMASGRLHIEVDGVDKTGPMIVPNTGDYSAWQTVIKTGVALTVGPHVVKVMADAEFFDLNYVSILDMCDVNKDAQTDVVDIQQAVNQSVGTTPFTFDLNGNGMCDVVDVQRVVNATLGGICVNP